MLRALASRAGESSFSATRRRWRARKRLAPSDAGLGHFHRGTVLDAAYRRIDDGAPGDKDQPGLYNGGDVLRLAVAEGVFGIGRPGGNPDGQEGDADGEQVEEAIDRLR
jgi:hypothetical protein